MCPVLDGPPEKLQFCQIARAAPTAAGHRDNVTGARREETRLNEVIFRPYCHTDLSACLDVFDANCPAYFAPNEREQYASFLADVPDGYTVCELNSSPVGAFGLSDDGDNVWRLNWILMQPDIQGHGIGSLILNRALHSARSAHARLLKIGTSPRSEGFFARFGARPVTRIANGWGPGLDRVDMEITL